MSQGTTPQAPPAIPPLDLRRTGKVPHAVKAAGR